MCLYPAHIPLEHCLLIKHPFCAWYRLYSKKLFYEYQLDDGVKPWNLELNHLNNTTFINNVESP